MITPFLIGLAGSFHCIGMCGPLAAAVNGGRNIVYNAGRIFTYGLLGILVSFIGMGLNLAGVQQIVSITVGIAILILAVTKVRMITPTFIVKFMMKVRSRFKLHPLFSGMLNGILPCGMTLVALGYCVTLSTPLDGFLSMIAFGLGTLPAMLGFGLISRTVIQRVPNIQTMLMIVSGILLIGRGIHVEVHSEGEHEIVVCGVNSQK